MLEPTVEATVVQQATNHLLPQLKFLEKHLRLLWKTMSGSLMTMTMDIMPTSVDLEKAVQSFEKMNLPEPSLQKLQNLDAEVVLWMSPMWRRLWTLMQRRLKTVSRRSLSVLSPLKRLDRGLAGDHQVCLMSLQLNFNLHNMRNHVTL